MLAFVGCFVVCSAVVCTLAVSAVAEEPAGKLAESLLAKNLILYHTEDETLQTRKRTYTSEARTVFNGNIFVPDDFEVIDLK